MIRCPICLSEVRLTPDVPSKYYMECACKRVVMTEIDTTLWDKPSSDDRPAIGMTIRWDGAAIKTVYDGNSSGSTQLVGGELSDVERQALMSTILELGLADEILSS